MKSIKIGRYNKHKRAIVTVYYSYCPMGIKRPMTRKEIGKLLERERKLLTKITMV